MSGAVSAVASDVQLLAFDVFGTVVDWYSGVARDIAALGLDIDPDRFCLDWRAGYRPAMARVRSGELPWLGIDGLHRLILDELLVRYGQAHVGEAVRAELNLAWHRLDPWPDVVAGLTRLKRRFVLSTLSNGSVRLLTDLVRRGSLPFDGVISAEVFRTYKPDPASYQGLARIYDVTPAQMLMVATHKDDLQAAQAAGCRVAFIERPLEFGPGGGKDDAREPGFDLHARDFNDLADQLGC